MFILPKTCLRYVCTYLCLLELKLAVVRISRIKKMYILTFLCLIVTLCMIATFVNMTTIPLTIECRYPEQSAKSKFSRLGPLIDYYQIEVLGGTLC